MTVVGAIMQGEGEPGERIKRSGGWGDGDGDVQGWGQKERILG